MRKNWMLALACAGMCCWGNAGGAETAPVPDAAPARAEAPAETARAAEPVISAWDLAKGERPVYVSQAAITARITGNVAETTLDLTFHNPNSRALEGDFVLPLPDDATVSNLALDVDGEMVDASVVDKEKARRIFEEAVRDGIDPALTEHVGGNCYRTSVYPLPANGSRRLRLRYVSPLLNAGGERVYRLPLNFPHPMQASLRVEVVDPGASPRLSGGGFANLRFREWKRMLVAEEKWADIALTEDLRVAVAVPPQPLFFAESHGGDVYFTAEVDVPSPRRENPEITGADIIWDASLSRLDADHEAEFAFLRAWGKRHAPGRKLDVRVHYLRNDLEPGETLEVSGDDMEPLVAVLRKTVYDGATDFGALNGLPGQGDAAVRPALLFSDGMHNFGEKITRSWRRNLHAVVNGRQADAAYLRFLAENCGGGMVNLAECAPEEAARALAAPRRFFGCVTPGAAVHASPRGENRWQVWGKIPGGASAGRVSLSLNFGDVILPLTVAASGARPGTLLRTLFGMGEVKELARDPATPLDAFLALGREYGLVTPGTSLLVLENEREYVRHGVRPPDSKPDWVAYYEKCMAEHRAAAEKKAGEEAQKRQTRLDKAVKRYQKEMRDGWYGKEFDLSPPVYRKPTRASVDFSSSSCGKVAGVLRRTISHARIGSNAPKRRAPKPEEKKKENKFTLKPWDPAEPYLQAMKAQPENAYALYLRHREHNRQNIGFYTDCSDYFLRAGERRLALRVLSNIGETALQDRTVLRVFGYKLRYMGEYAAAERVLRQVLALAPREGQSARDLALTLEDAGKFQEAAEMFVRLITGELERRFNGMELIAITELNHVLARAERRNIPVTGIDPRLRFPLGVDLRVVINWDTDISDMDLHVYDPYGGHCYFGHRLTRIGGHLSHDFTRGFGPEEFMTRQAVKGEYKVKAHYFSNRSQGLLAPVTLYAEVYTDYGRENEERQTLTFRLDKDGGSRDCEIGTFVKEPVTPEEAAERARLMAPPADDDTEEDGEDDGEEADEDIW